MKRPQLIDLEFSILLFVVGGGMVYSLFRGMFALLDQIGINRAFQTRE